MNDELSSTTKSALSNHFGDSTLVSNDTIAIATWLNSYRNRSKETIRSFSKEAIRFLMWVELRKGQGDSLLRGVTAEDANEYLDFLIAPQIFPTWILQKYGYSRQPFHGKGLCRESIRQAVIILNRMFSVLQNIQIGQHIPYVQLNPFVLVKAMPISQDFDTKKALTKEEWSMVQDTIELLPRNTKREQFHYYRTRWIFQLLYRLWVRRATLSSLKMGDFFPSSDGWMIQVTSKGNKTASLIASTKLMSALMEYRFALELPELPTPNDSRPLVSTLYNPYMPLSPESLYAVCRVIYRATAERVAETHPYTAEKLRKAGPHTMRHTGISHAIYSGVSLTHVNKQAMHANIQTTVRYVQAQKDIMMDEFEKCD
ncbi:MAG: tyrosine-type recombinase/integrase [Burkholderiales bacterium]|nr:tyrosine-type recombinase/integrase [Burkholderiales bacterium]